MSTITTSILTAGSNNHATTSYEANAFATDFVGQGIVGTIANTLGVAPCTGGFAVNAQGSPAMFVDVTAGVAWITATPSGQASQSLRAYMTANYTSYAISANASGSTKYDWIYLKVSPTAAANPDAAADDVTALFTSRSSSNTTDNGSPPTYGIPLAIITVANGASSIGNASIKDNRSQVIPSAQVSGTGTGWTTSTVAPNSVTANGNRSYNLVFNSTDLTGSVSPGMRIQATRTVTAPTQCTSLNGTTQYYSKTSPSGMTFTNNFVVSAWVKLSSYAAGDIASRYNGTSGWGLQIDSQGRVLLYGKNAGSGNVSEVFSYQSIPLNKWVHVAAQLDMSSFTATPTTSYTMIDGVDVPAQLFRAGTNPTALIQAGNLEIGSENAGTTPFPGKIAQVAIYNSKVTQATILASISQTLSGSETSLISAYSFNNSINDLNANANNLTANGSAVATALDTPFTQTMTGISTGTTNFGIVTSISFSSNTTMVVQVAEGGTIPTTGGVSAVAYSTHKTPYGFPGQRVKWSIETVYITGETVGFGATAQWFASNFSLNVPIGEWDLAYQVQAQLHSTVSGSRNGVMGLHNSTYNPLTNGVYSQLTVAHVSFVNSSSDGIGTITIRPTGFSISGSSAVFNLKLAIISASGSETATIPYNSEPSFITAQCAYL